VTRPRVAVVSPEYGDPWSERQFLVRRISAGLAHAADVDVIVPAATSGISTDAAVTVRRVRAFPSQTARHNALKLVAFGPPTAAHAAACTCERTLPNRSAITLPRAVQEELALTAPARSPELLDLLAVEPYELVVFADWSAASTFEGVRHVAANTRVALLPLAVPDPLLDLPIYDEVFDRADVIVTLSDAERIRMADRSGRAADVVRQRVPLRINPLAHRDPPPGYDGAPTVVVARDWDSADDCDELYEWSQRLTRDVRDDLRFRQVGPGADRLHWWVAVPGSDSRTDVWRWMAIADVVIDPRPHAVFGREVLESMLLGTPVLVNAAGDATREHAEVGNGGLWFSGYDEVAAAVAHVIDNRRDREALGKQGQSYAETHCGIIGSFASDVVGALLT